MKKFNIKKYINFTHRDLMDMVPRLVLGLSFSVVILLIILFMFKFLFLGLWPLLKAGDEKGIQLYLESEGFLLGWLLTILLSALQVMSVVLPGLPIHIAAGLIYGWFIGSLACYLGFVLANAVMFLLTRRFGSRFTKLIPGIDKPNFLTEKINSIHPGLVVAISCLMPAFPNGIIPLIAAGSRITFRRFIIAIAASCWLQCVLNCLAGDFLIRGKYFFTGLTFVIQIVAVLLVTWKHDAILKLFD